MDRRLEVKNAEQALAYITDCNLATVVNMAMKKKRPKYEFDRQISIAQTAINWMDQMNIDYTNTRAEKVKEFGSVLNWAEQYYPS